MANGKPKREKVANRLYIDLNGKVVDDEQDATGVRFENLERGETVTVQYADFNPIGQRMGWAFGMKTWIGNLFNQELDLAEIEARLDSVKGGEWPERQGVGGPRYDAEALSKAIAEVKGADDAAPFAKRIADEKGYGTMALKVPDVMAAYNRLIGKVVTVANL